MTFGPNINLSVQTYSQGSVQRETTIAVNPRNPLNIVEGNIDVLPKAGQVNNSFSFTFDGGRTWALGGVVPLQANDDNSLDPAIAADADGNFYYSYLDFGSTGPSRADLRLDVVVAKSTDGGRTFPTLSIVRQGTPNQSPFLLPDKDYIAVDTQALSPFKGNVYVVWTESSLTVTGQIMGAVSSDGGATWSAPVGVTAATTDPNEVVLDALPVVAPDGTVYVFYDDSFFGVVTPTTSIKFSRSKDGGRTWSRPANVASGLLGPTSFRLQNSDPQWASKELVGIFTSPYPGAAIAPDGTIFVAWTDVSQGSCVNNGTSAPPCMNSDVRLAVSRNGGRSWTAPVKVSDDAGGADQFNPWIAVHPNGLLSLTWQDKRLDPNNINFDTFYTNTFDGSTFLPNVRVTSETSLSGNGETPVFDYIGMAASADGIFPVWTDMRSGNPDIYVAAGRFGP